MIHSTKGGFVIGFNTQGSCLLDIGKAYWSRLTKHVSAVGVLSCLLGLLVGGTLGQFWTWLCAQTQVEGSSAFWLQAFFVSLSLCLSLSKKAVPAKLRLILDSAAVFILHIIELKDFFLSNQEKRPNQTKWKSLRTTIGETRRDDYAGSGAQQRWRPRFTIQLCLLSVW